MDDNDHDHACGVDGNLVLAVERSQIVVFNGGRYRVLVTLSVRLGGVAQLPDLHSAVYHLTLIGEGKPDRPVAWMRLIWLGDVPIDAATP